MASSSSDETGGSGENPKKSKKNIAVFSEKTDVPHLPNQSMVA